MGEQVDRHNKGGERPLVVFITGLSGAGLKTAVNILEDSGVYCVDNLPLAMIEPALELIQRDYIRQAASPHAQGVVFGIHFHDEQQVGEFIRLKEHLAARFAVDVVFLTADPMTIEDRYGANRRRHPLLKAGVTLKEAIAAEIVLLQEVEKAANVILDTTNLAPQQLAQMIESRYCQDITPRRLNVSLISFGFKHGPLRPLDLMFDVRFLANPFFVMALREKTGLDPEVRSYIFNDPSAQEMIKRLVDWHRWLLPKYYDEGKHYLRVGIGCTGGQHRSVAMVEELTSQLSSEPLTHISITRSHRDLDLPLA